jgi:GH24 family phage-related lysozyme (muramidase)
MPRLPTATDLSGSGVQPARSFVNIPVPDIAGAANSVARGFEQVGMSIENVRKDREEKFRKQERFDTKMGLLKAEEAYAERARDLDPLDPDYVEKKKALYREAYAPVLSGVKDPENKQMFDLSSYEGFVNIGTRAGEEHKAARQGKTKLDLSTYSEEQRRRIAAGEDPEKVRAAVQQMIADADLDELTKLELGKQLLDPIDMDAAETKAFNLQTGGGGATDKAAAILRQFEGFKATPYWDENADRVGYGSDTVTLEDGTVVKVTKGMKITKADAERDLQRRVREFEAGAAKASGEAWNNLSPEQQAALTSVAYNYGSLPKRVVTAIQTGDANKIADAVESLSDHNAGINRKRRMAEGALIRGNANIPAAWSERPTRDTVLAELERDPSYLRLGVDQRDKVKASVISRYEKVEAEEKKSFELNTAREAANAAAAGVKTLADGYAWLDENIEDPEIREKARTMFKSEFEANEKLRETEYEAALDKVYVDVVNAVNSGNISAAFAAIPTGLNRKDLDALEKRIADGPIQIDDPRDLERINDLKYSRDPEDQKAFSRLELNRFRLSDATREKVFKEQQSILKELEQTGSAPSLVEPSKMLNDRLMEIGIDTSTGVKSEATRRANLRLERQIKTILDQNLKIATDRAGRKLLPDELQRVMDDTFLEFSRTKTVDTWGGLGSEQVPAGDLPSVIADFDIAEQTANAQRAKDELPPLAPGELLQQAIDERTREHAEAKAIVAAEMKALMSRARSPQARMQGNLEAEYARLAQAQRDLEAFRIDAEDLYLWLARTFKKEEE